MGTGGLNFLTTSLALAAEYRDAGFAPDDAERVAKGQTLIAKVENATSVDDLRDVVRTWCGSYTSSGIPFRLGRSPSPIQLPVAPSR